MFVKFGRPKPEERTSAAMQIDREFSLEQAKGWTIRDGRTRCAACSEVERRVLARALGRSEG
jgi:hypothetical protein